MTDNEIIKDIDKCLRADDCHTSECPFFDGSKDGWDCQLAALSLARDLINRQKAEIERLQEHNNTLIGRVDNLVYECDCAKQEAIIEFVERLHCHCESIINVPWNEKIHPNSWACAYEEFEEVIDNLVKEMVGDDNEM